MFKLDTLMTTNLVTVTPSSSLHEARSKMQEHRIRHLPVIDAGGALVGLLTQTDVYAAMDSILRDRSNRMPIRDFPVEDVMVTDVFTVDEQISLRQAALMIEQRRIGCLPVVSGQKLVGIITDTDFVGVAINLLEQIEESEPMEELESA